MRGAALGAVALGLSATAAPSRAQDVALADVGLRPSLAASADSLSATAEAPGPSSSSLTSAVLAAYVARQQARKGFDIFGAAPQPQLTSAVVSAYAATHYHNAALSAIDTAASPSLALGPTFSAEQEDDAAAAAMASADPSISEDTLAKYARQQFEPTERKIKRATDEKLCLSKAIYHEARGESDNGQWAVANVIINRALSKRFPATMCGVIYQNADQGKYRCQFSFACDGQPDMATERRAWVKANQIAAAAYSEFQHGERPGVLPSSALYYHTTSVTTDWGFKRVAQIGAHVFFSPM
ncbi:MAG: cell wall hydrolase [Devosia sp.]|nr:cell wall hydrolase [Devosia sp.]